MKHLLLFIIPVILLVSCSNDVDPSSLSNNELKEYFTKDIKAYLTEINKGNWDSAMDFAHPSLFEIAPKKDVIESLAQLENMGMEMTIDFIGLGDVSELVEHEKDTYCRIEYNATISIIISGSLLDLTNELTKNFEKSYGEGTVNYNESDHSYTIDASRIMIAITKKGTSAWKYLEYNPGQEEILRQLLPQKIISQFGFEEH